jgi:methenyltetrahydrofolate cyclohydrolase
MGARCQNSPARGGAVILDGVPPAAEHTVASYLDALGARTPAPASGSGAALAGAMGAALAELAARFSDEREATSRLQELRSRLVELADEDADAYAAFLRTRSEADCSRTIDVPLAIAETAAEVAALARILVEGGNPRVAGDAEAGAVLAAAAARIGARLVEINLAGSADPRLEHARAAVAAAG